MVNERRREIMKKEIFKVCALGLVAVTLVTGCGKNEKENE